jgi:lactoylglutathione lyase
MRRRTGGRVKCHAAAMTELASLVLFTSDVDAAARFYRAIGLPLEGEDHGEGPVHFAAEVGDVHFALYPASTPGRAPERRSAGSSFPGVYVESLDDALRELQALDAQVLTGHEVMPWGCRFVAQDPDGRAVEVNDKSHCNRPDSEAAAP